MMQQGVYAPNVLRAFIYNIKGTIQEAQYISVEFIDVQSHWHQPQAFCLAISVKINKNIQKFTDYFP